MNVIDFLSHYGIGLIVVVLSFGFIIFIHELGHFIMAKRVGVRVLEFAMGFGPRLLMRKKGETEYSLRLFPFGGYVRMEGEDSPAEDTSDVGNFQNRTVWERIKIVAGGPLMNYISALFIFWFVGFVYGVGDFYGKPMVGAIFKNKPADKMGLKPGDYIIEINGKSIDNYLEMINTIHENPGKELTVKIVRKIKTEENIPGMNGIDFVLLSKKAVTETMKIEGTSKVIGILGFTPETAAVDVKFTRVPFCQVLEDGVKQMCYYTAIPFLAFYKIVREWKNKETREQVIKGSAGPIGIGHMFFELYQKGFKSLLYFGAVINILIGCFNLVPFPALDGSRIFFLIISGIRRKPFNQEKEGLVHLVGFIILLVVVLFFTIFDIQRIFKGQSFFK